MMKDCLTRALLCDGNVSAFALCSTKMCQEVRSIHNCQPCAAAALGRSLSGAVLMSTTLKGKNDKLSLIIDGDGPAGKIICTVTNDGIIKGYIQNPQANLPIRQDGKLNVGGVVGRGKLTVIRDEGQPEPYIGLSELVSGEIAEDIASYYAISEQLPTAVILGVMCDRNGDVVSAGGMFISPLPGCPDSVLIELEDKLKSLESFSTLLPKYECMEELLFDNFWDIGVQPLETKEVSYNCDCSRQRMESALISLGKQELQELSKDPVTQMCCHFCNRKYDFTTDDILNLIGESNG